jgi:hypothetical protein
MAEQQDDSSTNEDRFARQDFSKSSRWSTAVVIVVIMAVIVGLVYFFLK